MVYSVELPHCLTGYINEIKKYWEHWLNVIITPCAAFYSEAFYSKQFLLHIHCNWIILPFELNIWSPHYHFPPPKLLGEEGTAVIKIYTIPEGVHDLVPDKKFSHYILVRRGEDH
ncbi:hypothetical protein PAXINDRAFT_17562 [Paxillus involutus ATCC 200175]|uniref:Unplaced genomic scaffold PAXINscaffold_151, whole genome shotgun sequence n=1 Tax=Paxillus involutus ATCC 200175 TaxID=664439 RepID=A0A0C9TND2_PAXIN|nr:hypothetical protein PAXINDRAFT_17562 [Paxillus involutus ATCC 200175]